MILIGVKTVRGTSQFKDRFKIDKKLCMSVRRLARSLYSTAIRY